MFIIVRRASLAEVLQDPGLLLVGLDLRFRGDANHLAECAESVVGPSATTRKDRSVRIWHLGLKALDVLLHDPVHRTEECLASLDPAKEEPAPRRLLLDFPIG